MHTGYDNFWMYQNSRHEPVLSLPKNDTYKQVLNGGSPNNFSSCIMPQNNVARSHHSDQHRITGSQYVWPSSVYSLPYRSSHANNFHSQESYPNQCSNLSYSSHNYQIQQNYDSRYLRNRNLNFSYVNNNTNCDNYNHPAKTQSNENTNTSVARIRVKDVYTLNSNSIFDNSLFQNNQKEQSECSLNYTITSNLTSCDSKMPSEYVDYEKINLLESSNPPSYYGHKVTGQSHANHQQQFFQHSDSFFQPIDQPTPESEFLLRNNKEKNFSLDTVKMNPSLTGQMKNHAEIKEPERNLNDSQHGSKRIKVQPKRNSSELRNLDNSETRDFCVSSEKCNNNHCSGLLAASDMINNASTTIRVAPSQSLVQENLSKTDKNANSLTQDSLIGKLRKWRKTGQCFAPNSNSPSQSQINGQRHSMIKITIPHTGQSSFVNLKDSGSVEGTCNISSICAFEAKSQLSHTLRPKIPTNEQINTQKNSLFTQINQDNLINSIPTHSSSQLVCSNSPNKTQKNHPCFTALISPPKVVEFVDKRLDQKVVGVALNNRENSNVDCSETISEKFSLKTFDKNKEISTEINCSNSIILNSLAIKQEILGVENPHDLCNPIKQVYDQIIKIEKNPEDSPLHIHKTESPYSGNSNPLEKIQLLDAKSSENINFNVKDVEKLVRSSEDHEPVSETLTSSALNNTENCTQEVDAFKNATEGEKSIYLDKSKTVNPKLDIMKVPTSKENYTSKINRDKLDLLIEFLNKEDTSEKTSTTEETNHSLCLKKPDKNNQIEKEIKRSRNRRKLSKTCIVKNKNNSREMVSLLAHKVSQVEIFKCSSKTSQIVETNNNSVKSEEKDAGYIALSTKKSEEENASAESGSVKNKIDEEITNLEETRSVKDKDFDLSGKHAEINNLLLTLSTQKDPLNFDTKDTKTSGNKKYQDTSEENSSGKECDIQEEENVINTMRAFQNFKTHFCMSCDLISGVDSFWINVVSGELRCLNCFKKMLLKAEDNILKLKAEVTDNNNDSDTNFVPKVKQKQASENGEENKLKTGSENDLKSKNRLLDFTEFHCGNKTGNNLKEDVKQELPRQINEIAKNKIMNKSNGQQSFVSDFRKKEIMDCSNSSKKRIELRENNASLLEKILEKQELKVGESKNKLKEDESRKMKICEGTKKQEIKEFQEKSRKKSFTKEDEIVSPELRVFSNVSKKNSSATETFPLNHSNGLEEKNSLKKSVNPKFNYLENYNEILSEGSEKKIISKESHTGQENLKQLSKECKRHNSTDKFEKSNKKGILKEEVVAEELIRKEKKLTKNLQNQIRKRNNSAEESICQKVHILEERSKKELQLIESSDKSILKTCSTESCVCHKTHNLENMKINSKYDSSDKLKVESPLKETCFDYKTKILEHTKSRDIHLAHECKGKSGWSSNSLNKHKKVEVDQSKKRKNSDDYSPHKIRVVEELTKKEIKPVAQLSERAKFANKEHSGNFGSKRLESEKQNLKDSGEKLSKNSLSKADYSAFGKFLKKEEKQVTDSSDKWNSKGDLILGKAKNPENTKPEGLDSSQLSRRRSKERCPVISKENSKNEIKKLMGSEGKLRSYVLKEVIDPSKVQTTKITKKEMKNASLPPKGREWERPEEKNRKHFCGKIPKRPNSGLDMNINVASKSSVNYKLKEISDAIVKKKQNARVTSESPSRNCNRESIKNEGIIANKKEGRNETEINKREKEVFFKQGNLKDKKELENNANQGRGQGQTKHSNNYDRKEKAIECYGRIKEDVSSSECRQNSSRSEKMEAATLLEKLIKKTKKLSWSLLKEP